jgi:hypothetical protein
VLILAPFARGDQRGRAGLGLVAGGRAVQRVAHRSL